MVSGRSEGSRFLSQGKLREEPDMKCHPEQSEGSDWFLRSAQDKLRLTPQNDIATESLKGKGIFNLIAVKDSLSPVETVS